MSHGPNRYRDERRAAETAAQRAGHTLADPRAQRIIAVWNTRARRGQPAEFFPTFATALAARCSRMTYCCPACQQLGTVDLLHFADAHHPRAPISILIPKLSCNRCCPNPPLAVLLELGLPESPPPSIECEFQHQPTSLRGELAPPVPTMEALPNHGVSELSVWCGRWPLCSYRATLSVDLIDLKQTIVQFAAKLQCPECGTIGGQAMPRWPNGGGGPGGAHNHGGKL